MRQKVESAGKAVIKNNSQVSAVLGGKFVEKIRFITQAKEEEISVQGMLLLLRKSRSLLPQVRAQKLPWVYSII